jgi:phosphatidylethanolamine-binding protein (PEBP) family uncharacterized protein
MASGLHHLLSVSLAALAVSACATGDGRDLRPPTDPAPALPADAPADLNLVDEDDVLTDQPLDADLDTVPAAQIIELYAPWIEGGAIEARHGCDGTGVSPLLTWSTPPQGTAEVVMVASDVSNSAMRTAAEGIDPTRLVAPLDPDDPIHWIIVGIDPASQTISEGGIPAGATFLMNAFGESRWTPPCPPEGGAMDLQFTLAALAEPLGIPSDLDAIGLAATLDLISASTISTAISLGTYQR